MTKSEIRLTHEFKRLIHLLSVGKRKPISFDGIELYRAEIHIIEIIGMSDGVTVTELAEMLTVTKGAISQIVNKLHAKELIEKTDKDTRNKVILSLSPKGRVVFSLHNNHEGQLLTSIREKLDGISEADVIKFAEVVSEISGFIGKN